MRPLVSKSVLSITCPLIQWFPTFWPVRTIFITTSKLLTTTPTISQPPTTRHTIYWLHTDWITEPRTARHTVCWLHTDCLTRSRTARHTVYWLHTDWISEPPTTKHTVYWLHTLCNEVADHLIMRRGLPVGNFFYNIKININCASRELCVKIDN